jgi:hypothetical protein
MIRGLPVLFSSLCDRFIFLFYKIRSILNHYWISINKKLKKLKAD